MKLRNLLAIPLAFSLAACCAQPEFTVTTSEDTFVKCLAKDDGTLDGADRGFLMTISTKTMAAGLL